MLQKRNVDARRTNRQPADVHHFYNQSFPLENLVNKDRSNTFKIWDTCLYRDRQACIHILGFLIRFFGQN